jgi:hypothetical protein
MFGWRDRYGNQLRRCLALFEKGGLGFCLTPFFVAMGWAGCALLVVFRAFSPMFRLKERGSPLPPDC